MVTKGAKVYIATDIHHEVAKNIERSIKEELRGEIVFIGPNLGDMRRHIIMTLLNGAL